MKDFQAYLHEWCGSSVHLRHLRDISPANTLFLGTGINDGDTEELSGGEASLRGWVVDFRG